MFCKNTVVTLKINLQELSDTLKGLGLVGNNLLCPFMKRASVFTLVFYWFGPQGTCMSPPPSLLSSGSPTQALWFCWYLSPGYCCCTVVKLSICPLYSSVKIVSSWRQHVHHWKVFTELLYFNIVMTSNEKIHDLISAFGWWRRSTASQWFKLVHYSKHECS